MASLKCMSVDRRNVLRASRFDSIRALHFMEVPEAARLIEACPNLELFCTSYPCPKPKITLKAVAKHAGIKYVELRCQLWRSKHLSGLSLRLPLPTFANLVDRRVRFPQKRASPMPFRRDQSQDHGQTLSARLEFH
jgi:hypothetical protein